MHRRNLLDTRIISALTSLLLVSTFLSATHAQQPTDPMVRTDATEQISEHVYVIPDGGVGGVPNVGFVVGDNATLVIDTGLGHANGLIVLAEALKVSQGTSLYLVTTHVHPEHDLGAHAFPAETRMIRSTAQVTEIAEAGLRTADAFRGRSDIMRQLLEGAEFRAADITFEDEHELDLGGVRVRLLAMGPNHTAGDTAIIVEEEGVVFAGDIVMEALPAFASASSSVAHWLQSLDRLAAFEPTIVVPSHGPLGDLQFINRYRNYLGEITTRTVSLKEAGTSLEQTAVAIRAALEAEYGNSARIDGAVRAAYAENPPFENTYQGNASVSQGLGEVVANLSITTACTSSVRFVVGESGRVTATDGTQWTVPMVVNEGAGATDMFNDCTGGGDNPDYLEDLETVVIDEDGEVITAHIFGDNYYELYINGQFVARDSISFIPFNSTAVRFKASYPITVAVHMADWETHFGVGMEYDSYNVGDAGFIAQFDNGAVTDADWKVLPVYIGPLDDPGCVVEDGSGNPDATACSIRPRCADADPNSCRALHYALPEGWTQPGFDDSEWSTATLYEAEQVTGARGYVDYAERFGEASFIWSPSLKLDNQVLSRFVIEAP